MKINWFSPLPNARTDIAHYTARLLPDLTALADVTLWTEQNHWDPALEQFAPIRTYDANQPPWAELNHADINYYNIGNNAQFHAGIWQVSRQCPGVVVLHDFRLQHFFAGIYIDRQNNRHGFEEFMARCYGSRGRDAAQGFFEQRMSLSQIGEPFPLAKAATDNALGVLVHSPAAFELEELSALPRCLQPLPYPARHAPVSVSKEAAPPYKLIVFGYIGDNRRVESLLEALAQLPEKQAFELDIYGEIPCLEYFNNLISSLDLKGLVTIKGFVPETELDQALSQAHLAINLRFPTMGESSGSQLRIWDHALPSMVTRVGWYATLPEQAVAFVDPQREIDDIQGHLRHFLAAPEKFAGMGQHGRDILIRQHAPKQYAAAIVAFAEQLFRCRCQQAAFQLAAVVGRTVSGSLPPGEEAELVRKVSAEIFRTFNASPEQSSGGRHVH